MTPPPHQDNPVLGMSCALAAHFMLSLMMVFAKLLSDTLTVVEISFYRNLLSILPFLVYGLMLGHREIFVIRSSRTLLITRAVIGTFSLMVTFGAFALLPMADATVLLFSSTLIMPVLSFLFLKELIGHIRWIAIAAGMIGIIIMAQPSGHNINPLGVACALTAACMHAVLGVILRKLGKTESPLTITFYFVTIGCALSALAMPFIAKMPTQLDWLLILGLGMTGVMGQFFLSTAFKYIPASLATIFTYTGIIWSTLFGWALFNDWPAPPIWIGGAIVIASNLSIFAHERYKASREQERQREQETTLS